ncbi:HD domain-containing protein [Brevibacillus composti]|uniref:HD domain-containing protein n=2 Tax=Brevibacillus composti TaxID=2796470 RepID=A0A7T5EL18_9BACL|nr:HD domain-containing protein [Brevibacillus composti]QUO41605.1 HD domain-containing protein [Brevibacillus composti]
MLMKVKDRIFVALLFLCLVPILLVSLVNYHAAEEALFEQYAANITEHLQQLDDRQTTLEAFGEWSRQVDNPVSPTLVMIFSKEKVLLYPRNTSTLKWIIRDQDYASLLQLVHESGGKEVLLYSTSAGDMYLFSHISPYTGSTYVELLPVKEIENDLDPLKEVLFIVTILVILFAAIVAHQVARWFDRPIRSLIEATEALQQGDFTIRVEKHGMAEIAHLEDKFNQMASQLQVLIQRERKYMQAGLEQIVRSFYLAVEMKDPYTAGHSERVTEYALIIYDHLIEKGDFSRDDLRFAGLMHDIGKVAIPDRVLLKEGKLTDEEYELIKLHASIGANIVNQIESLSHVSPGVRHHHERWDGRGYPDGLSGERIPLMGRILAVADTFDAMTSTRSYRQAMTLEEAHAEILRCSGTQFDPAIVYAFHRAFSSGACHVHMQRVHQRKGEEAVAARG